MTAWGKALIDFKDAYIYKLTSEGCVTRESYRVEQAEGTQLMMQGM